MMNQSQPDFSVHCGYDLNGNITSLRRGGSGAYDVLTMGYEGNRLTSVTDCGNDNLLGEVPQLAAGGAASGRWWQHFSYLRGRVPPLPERGWPKAGGVGGCRSMRCRNAAEEREGWALLSTGGGLLSLLSQGVDLVDDVVVGFLHLAEDEDGNAQSDNASDNGAN